MGPFEGLKDVMGYPRLFCFFQPWPCPSLRWEGLGRCADLPPAVTSPEPAGVPISCSAL